RRPRGLRIRDDALDVPGGDRIDRAVDVSHDDRRTGRGPGDRREPRPARDRRDFREVGLAKEGTRGAERDEDDPERELEREAPSPCGRHPRGEPRRPERRLAYALSVDGARERRAEGVLIALVHGRIAPRTSRRVACAARSFASACDSVAPTVPPRIAKAVAICPSLWS